MKLKKLLCGALALATAGLLIAGCGGSDKKAAAPQDGKKVVLKVGATPVPHAEILNFVKPQLAKEGVDLQVVEFTDYVKPNLSLSDKELDANYFQHIPYLEKFSKDRNLKLAVLVKVHIEPMGVYSHKIKDLKDLKEGAKVKAYVFFRGRSIVFKEQGEILLLRFATDLEEVAKVEMMPKLDGKKMNMMLAPKSKK